jgi:DNA polymerase-3 subunit epsilon
MISTNDIQAIQASPDDFKLIRRVPFELISKFPHAISDIVGDEVVIQIIDTETTGLEPSHNEIIEFGWTTVGYSPSEKRVSTIYEVGTMLQAPKDAISEEITSITGITNEMVAGKRFDESKIKEILTGNGKYVIAHNAAFDKGFIEHQFNHILVGNAVHWGCSLNDINWSERGYPSRSLEMLLLKEGFFYTAHRACNDTNATAFLLDVIQGGFEELIGNINTQYFTIYAVRAPFDVKDTLKANDFKWDADKRVWHITIAEAQKNEILNFLDSLYPNGAISAQIEKLPIVSQY